MFIFPRTGNSRRNYGQWCKECVPQENRHGPIGLTPTIVEKINKISAKFTGLS